HANALFLASFPTRRSSDLFVLCAETQLPLLDEEAERCDVTNRRLLPGLLVRCEVTGKKVLPSLLEKSAATGKVALKKLFVSSSIDRKSTRLNSSHRTTSYA